MRRTLTALALASVITATPVAQGPPPPAGKGQPGMLPPPAAAGQAVNVKIELTITEQREGVAPTPKTITLMVADRERGQIRSGGGGDQLLNVDVRPEIVRDGRVRVNLTFDYRAPRTESDRTPPMLTQSLASIVDDGRPLQVSQWTEAGSTRSIKVELRTTIQK
jgi:hypothetical protein